MTTDNKKSCLYLVGIGPGDPELMTCKAVRVLEDSPVWIAPKARTNGNSNALQIASAQVDPADKTVLQLCFPMKKIRLGQQQDPEVEAGWRQAAEQVLSHLDQGLDVAFPTLGDPALYSTAFYLLATLQDHCPELRVKIIPGITAMSACSGQVLHPLAQGDDLLSVVPAAFDDGRLRQILKTFDVIVMMKVFRSMDRIINILDELDLTDKAVLLERCGLEGQTVYADIRRAGNRQLHYFSTLIVRKKQVPGAAMGELS